eukprot:scaffold24106_cov75-Phaeocystis_antarctica.AAC.1
MLAADTVTTTGDNIRSQLIVTMHRWSASRSAAGPAPRGNRRADLRRRLRARAASAAPASHRPSLSTSPLNQNARGYCSILV